MKSGRFERDTGLNSDMVLPGFIEIGGEIVWSLRTVFWRGRSTCKEWVLNAFRGAGYALD